MTSPSEIVERPEWSGKPAIVYDGDCPFCSRYVEYQRLKDAIGPVRLVDARGRPDLVGAFEAAGMPLDGGMALIMDGQIHYGADCMNRLALMSSRNGAFNALNAAIFRSRRVSHLLYPLLRTGRNLTLRLLGYRKLRDSL